MHTDIKDHGHFPFCLKLKSIKFKFLQDIHFNNSDIYISDVCQNLCLRAKKCQHLQVRQLNLIFDYEKGAYFQNVSLFLRIGLILSKNRKKRYICTIPACYMVRNSWNIRMTLPETVQLFIVFSMFLSKLKQKQRI